MADLGSTATLAAFVDDLTPQGIPADVEHMARLCILDWIACASAGATIPETRKLREVVFQGSADGASSLVGGGTCDALGSALHNAYASHVLEYDDTHPGAFTHITAPVLAAALAVAEERDSTLQDLVVAFVAGYETAARLGILLGKSMFEVHKVHPTGFLGYLGAAAAAGKLLRLPKDRIASALGIAGIQAGGLLESIGTMSEGYCAAHGSQGGVMAARLALAGFEGPTTVIEGGAGVFAAFGVPLDTDLGSSRFEMRRNEFKLYPTCGFIQPALDAVLGARESWQSVDPRGKLALAIRLWTPAADLVDTPRPTTTTEARFSAQFCAAVAWLDGYLDNSQFTEERLHDRDVISVMQCIVIERDDTMNRHQARITLSDSMRTMERFATNEGHPPSEAAIVDKFVRQAGKFYGATSVRAVARAILDSNQYSVVELLAPTRSSYEWISVT